MRQLYNITKKLSQRNTKPERPVKDNSGNQIIGVENQRQRWMEHFEELLNRPSPENPPDLERGRYT